MSALVLFLIVVNAILTANIYASSWCADLQVMGNYPSHNSESGTWCLCMLVADGGLAHHWQAAVMHGQEAEACTALLSLQHPSIAKS